MPWTTLAEPSLGLGLLKAVLDSNQIPCRVLHLNLFLLQHIKASTYVALAQTYALNDFMFSGSLDPVVTNTQYRLLREKVCEMLEQGLLPLDGFGGMDELLNTLVRLRREVFPTWLQTWAKEIASGNSTLVGFTCMFDQTIASLALAQNVRMLSPDKMLVLGGCAVRWPTDEMILRSHPWIDAICTGEGEVTAVALARASVGAIDLKDVPGISFRSATGEVVSSQSPPRADLDANPTPNFDDFYVDIDRLRKEHKVDILPHNLPVENSRGCWWGAKHHCVFCGIHDDEMAYRFRKSGSVLHCIEELQRRYGVSDFRFSDYILPNQYFNSLLPELARLGKPYRLSCEMKANSTPEKFHLLAKAGFGEVQAGIESFNSDVLLKMRKGVSAIQNVHTLLMGREFGIRIFYNLLFGFPDDSEIEYERMVSLLPRLMPLDPPVTCVPVQITRYAPLQAQPETFGIENASADRFYNLIFSRDYINRTGFDIQDFCYYFERPFNNSLRLEHAYRRIITIVEQWRSLWATRKVWLFGKRCDAKEDIIEIHDQRGPTEIVHRLDPTCTALLAACKNPKSAKHLRESNANLCRIDEAIDLLDSLGLVFREDDRVVSLVLSEAPPFPESGSPLQNPLQSESNVPAKVRVGSILSP